MEQFVEFLPYLVPIIILQLVLLIAALVDVLRRERTRGPKIMWLLIIVLVNVIGPILYFAVGREE